MHNVIGQVNLYAIPTAEYIRITSDMPQQKRLGQIICCAVQKRVLLRRH